MAPRSNLEQRLRLGPVLLDGATGTELERRGVFTALPLWSASALRAAPARVREIHADYARAGAEILVANTFRTNPRTLAAGGLASKLAPLTRRAIKLARNVATNAPHPVWVAASVAPVEDCYHPERTPDEPTLEREHGLLADTLADAHPDLLWIETMNTVREAATAARCARKTGLPLAVSFVLRENGSLLSGEPLRAAVDAVLPYQPLAIGLNCMPPRGIEVGLGSLRTLTDLPLIAYAHINNPQPLPGWSYAQSLDPNAYACEVDRWLACGARLIGGCCGTSPAHIAAIRHRGNLNANHYHEDTP